jgi:site-specific DNA-methyltransferase (adenine-specific)
MEMVKIDNFTYTSVGNNILFQGDCLDVMDSLIEKGVKVDLVITDPPYQIDNTKTGGKSNFAKSIQGVNDDLKNNKLNINLGVEFCNRLIKLQDKGNVYIWCNAKQIPQYLKFFVEDNKYKFDILVWNKTNAIPTFYNKYLTDKEYCLYFRKGGKCMPNNYEDAKTVWYQPINILDKKQYKHPTIKPLNIIETLIKNSSNENDLVLDCFIGSGTTGAACINTNRRFIGIELDEVYFNIAKDRISNCLLKK